MGSKKKKVYKQGIFLLKVVILVSTIYYLYKSVIDENQKPEAWFEELLIALNSGKALGITVAFGLLSLNWGLEARKWQLLAAKIETLTFVQAYRAVLVGISLGFITPNRLGDYAGRILELQSRQRLEAFGAIFLGRFCQLGITLAGGSIGIFYFLIYYFNLNSGVLTGIATTLLLVNGGIFLLLFRPHALVAAAGALPFLNQFTKYVTIISTYTVPELGNLLWLSLGRYVVFLGQFMLLLNAFGVHLTWYQMALAVSGTFLLKSVVPSVSGLADLGMRELAAIYFFGLLGQKSTLVMSASLSLWLINLGVPSLAGLAFVWRLKWKVKSASTTSKAKAYNF